MLHVPRFQRRQKSQEVSLKRAVGSRHSGILDVTDALSLARSFARDVSAGNASLCLSLSLFPPTARWIHYGDEQIFFQCRYS